MRISEYTDGLLAGNTLNEMEIHFRECPACSEKVKVLRSLENSLRLLPLEQPGTDFTRAVMKRLKISDSPFFIWNISTHLAPLITLIITVMILYLVMQWTGTTQTTEVQSSFDVTRAAYQGVSEKVSLGLSAIKAFIQQNISVIPGGKSPQMVLFLLLLFVGVGLVDKYLLMPTIMGKKNSWKS